MNILNKVKTSLLALTLIAVLVSQNSAIKVFAEDTVTETPTIVEEVITEEVITEEVFTEEAPVIEVPEVIEEPTPEVVLQVEGEDSAVCDASTTPVITVESTYYEYAYGVNLLTILADVNFNRTVVDPNGDPFTQSDYFTNPLLGGLHPHVGTYSYRYTATDINGCMGFVDIIIVIGPVDGLVCDATNRPTINLVQDMFKYPNGASLAEFTGDFDEFYSLSDPNSPLENLKTPDSHWVNELVGGWSALEFGDYVFHVSVIDEEGCRDDKEFTVRIGPDPVNNDGGGNNNDDDGEPVSFGSIGGGGGGNGNGRVLGATTCAPYITKYMKFKGNNDSKEVSKLQVFLNEKLGFNLEIDGVFGQNTLDGVRKFQLANAHEVLKPWGIDEPTDYVYLTTAHAINKAMCPELNTPAPTNLIPFSQYLKQA